MIESLLPVASLLHIDCEESTDQVFAFVRDEFELVMFEMVISFFYLVFHNGFFRLERKKARDKCIKNDSEGPNVYFVRMTLFPFQDLWCNIVGCSTDCSFALTVKLELGCKTEITDFDFHLVV